MIKIMMIDDEPSIVKFLEVALKDDVYELSSFTSPKLAHENLKKNQFDLIICDLQMPEMSGIDLLKFVKSKSLDTVFIMLTAFGTAETAVDAMKLGAYDYLLKPIKVDELMIIVRQALEAKMLKQENILLKAQLHKDTSFSKIIGNSRAMRELFEIIKKVAPTTSNILITGESGTGKELIAKAVHTNSLRANKPFVAINCGALTETLMESELFGHIKGSFTGAHADKTGLFKAANGGTLFLDEISEIPIGIQVKLLRAIQELTIRPVGATNDIKVDVRIVAATNKDLEREIEKGVFREDLYYRLNVIHVQTPPLRQRKEDIVHLVRFFIDKYAAQLKKNINTISGDALMMMNQYDWPGNVRELENSIERAIALEQTDILLAESLPDTLRGKEASLNAKLIDEVVIPEGGVNLDEIVGNLEKKYLQKALSMSKGIRKKAAEILGISFRSMRYRLDKYNFGLEDE